MNITPIVEALAALIGAVVTAVLIPYIKSKTTASRQEQLRGWVAVAVAAAEQIYSGSGRGKEKKEYVLRWLKDHGLTLDPDRLDALIEAAVYALKEGTHEQSAGAVHLS